MGFARALRASWPDCPRRDLRACGHVSLSPRVLWPDPDVAPAILWLWSASASASAVGACFDYGFRLESKAESQSKNPTPSRNASKSIESHEEKAACEYAAFPDQVTW